MTDGKFYPTGAAIDDRDEEDPEWTVDEEFSCTNTGYGGRDPASR